MRVPDSCLIEGMVYQSGCISRLSIIVQRSAFFLGAGATLIALIQVNFYFIFENLINFVFSLIKKKKFYFS